MDSPQSQGAVNGTAPQQVPPVDPGNPLLAQTPGMLSTARTPDGSAVLVTIRTPSTTLTVVLGRNDALNWARTIRNEAQGLSALVLPPGAAL